MIGLPSLETLEAASAFVHKVVPPTPQYEWPLLSRRLGARLFLKHENHTAIGSFKIRGALVFLDRLKREEPLVRAVVAATRGNYGQSVAFACSRLGLEARIVVPLANSREKNRAMAAFGAKLIEAGEDFDAAYAYARALAEGEGLRLLPSYHPLLAEGVASYGLELFRAAPDLDTLYVPIGLGSGISGMIFAREALGLKTEIVGVVAEKAPAYALSFKAGKPLSTESADTFADGLACRIPDAQALSLIRRGAGRVLTVSESEIKRAMRILFSDTHNISEGAGAAAFAGAFQERQRIAGKRVAAVLSGGNIDRGLFARILAEEADDA